MDFKELYNLPEQCIYAFLNKRDKKIYIGWTKNLISAIQQNINLMKYSNHPCKSDISILDFEVLENIVTESDLRIRCEHYSNKYSNEGWTLYRNYCAIAYKVIIDVFISSNSLSVKSCVKLQSKRRGELIVGIFETVSDAEVFVTDNYSNGVANIIYADNKLTKDFRAK